MTRSNSPQDARQVALSLEKTIYAKAQMAFVAAPQVALAGRSNVGKSSLINCLANRKNLAKTSSTPGKTRSLNYYLVHPEGFYLVDLPGYGYARRSKTERQAWARLMDQFFRTNAQLAGLLLILDARLPPQAPDLELLTLAQSLSLPMVAVLTKIDKCTQRICAGTRKSWQDVLGQNDSPLLFSAKTRQGRDQLWERIHLLVRDARQSSS